MLSTVRMADTCLPGLQGYPVQVEGWSGYPEKERLVVPNDISLQFSPAEVPLTLDTALGAFNLTGNHTFTMGGTQYTVRAIRLASPKQTGLKSFSSEPFAELTIWGLANPNQPVVAPLAALVIPIHIRGEETVAGTSLFMLVRREAVKLSSCIPSGKGVDVVRYMTCVENDRAQTTKIDVAYWTNGIGITQVQRNLFPQTLATWGIPPILGYKLLTVFSLTATGKGQRDYIEQNGMLKPYQSSIPISVSTTEFKNGFRLIRDFTRAVEKGQEIGAYKCVAIHRSRDIQNGKLLIDPATGRRLDEELKQADAEGTIEPQGYAPGKLIETIAIVLGVILGLTILAAAIYGMSIFLFRRKDAGLPPTTKEVERLAQILGKSIGS